MNKLMIGLVGMFVALNVGAHEASKAEEARYEKQCADVGMKVYHIGAFAKVRCVDEEGNIHG